MAAVVSSSLGNSYLARERRSHSTLDAEQIATQGLFRYLDCCTLLLLGSGYFYICLANAAGLLAALCSCRSYGWSTFSIGLYLDHLACHQPGTK